MFLLFSIFSFCSSTFTFGQIKLSHNDQSLYSISGYYQKNGKSETINIQLEFAKKGKLGAGFLYFNNNRYDIKGIGLQTEINIIKTKNIFPFGLNGFGRMVISWSITDETAFSDYGGQSPRAIASEGGQIGQSFNFGLEIYTSFKFFDINTVPFFQAGEIFSHNSSKNSNSGNDKYFFSTFGTEVDFGGKLNNNRIGITPSILVYQGYKPGFQIKLSFIHDFYQ